MVRRADDSTIETKLPVGIIGRKTPERLALVIAFHRAEPDRVGEVAFLEGEQLLGRGGPKADDTIDRVRFYRQRPGGTVQTDPLESEHVSRRQLVLRVSGDDRIELESVGRCPMLVCGTLVARATVAPGDTIAFANELVLYVTKRPIELAKAEGYPADFPFGGVDKFGIVGESPVAWRLRSELAFAASSEQHVLILGESGAGKELGAQAVHGLSKRSGKKLLSRNAATIPEGLVDAELFGHAKNYPNAGMPEREGLIGEADGTTLFLDEIGELPVRLQAHLLRVLDAKGEYQRLGETTMRRTDVRVVAATNRDPSELKHDFVARLALRVRVPPLGERPEDVPLLVNALLADMAKGNAQLKRFFDEKGRPRIDYALIDALIRHEYTLHARELSRLLWLAMQESDGPVIELGPGVRDAVGRNSAAPARADSGERDDAPPVDLSKEQIKDALDRARGNVTRAAKELGLKNRFVLYRLMKQLGMEPREEG